MLGLGQRHRLLVLLALHEIGLTELEGLLAGLDRRGLRHLLVVELLHRHGAALLVGVLGVAAGGVGQVGDNSGIVIAKNDGHG